VKKLEKTNKKHGTLAFITGNIVTGIETFAQKSRKRKSFTRRKCGESLSFVIFAVRVFNGHLPFTFDFIFQ